MKVVVGSKNPVKIQAIKEAFEKVWPKRNWQVEGIDVVSGVSDQPMSDEESIKGARNRAKRALKKTKADFGVGLEGGLQKIGKNWFDCGWVVVVDKHGTEGIGSSARMITPVSMMKLIKNGIELGSVNDMIFGKNNSKHDQGHFGLMTKGIIPRKEGYIHGVIFALARFITPEVFA